MEVKAYCDLDLQAIQALVRLQMFGKNEPGRRMRFWGAVYGCVAAAIVLEMIAWGFDADLLKLLIVCGIVALVGCNQYFLLPRLHYRSMAKLRGVRNAYTFTDSGMQVSSWGGRYAGAEQLWIWCFV